MVTVDIKSNTHHKYYESAANGKESNRDRSSNKVSVHPC